jgi:hypothetical protein
LLTGFKKRYGIKAIVLHGEAESANTEGIAMARGNVHLLLEGYSADETFNQDEACSGAKRRRAAWPLATRQAGRSTSSTSMRRWHAMYLARTNRSSS